jgi:hypothetical protein
MSPFSAIGYIYAVTIIGGLVLCLAGIEPPAWFNTAITAQTTMVLMLIVDSLKTHKGQDPTG